jgi:PadR family transcriptional regulator, regulatory protein AphA
MLNTQSFEQDDQTWVECLADGGVLTSEQDALDLVAACGEAGTRRLLIPAGCLNAAFFDLRNGLAGQVLLKFSNYRILAAAVIAAEIAARGRFGEFVGETNRGSAFRVFSSREDARAWLLSVR